MNKLKLEQLEALIRQVDGEFKTYFESKDAPLISLEWCFFERGVNVFFVKKEFDLLPIEIRLRTNQIIKSLIS